MMKWIFFLTLFACSLWSKPLNVYVSFYPLEFFAERIGGDLINVINPVSPEEDPVYWQPSREVLGKMQAADLIFLNGAEFEKWTATVNLPESKVIRTANGFKKDWLKYENAVTHSHGGGVEHSHEGVDGHTWLDPINAQKQCLEIYKALVKKLPKEKATLDANFKLLTKELASLDEKLKGIPLSKSAGHLLMSHPAYNYIAKRYGWKYSNLDLDPESPIEKKSLEKIKKLTEKHKVKYLLWESQPSGENIKALKDPFGISSLVISPVESIPEEDKNAGQNYLTLMNNNIKKLAEIKQ